METPAAALRSVKDMAPSLERYSSSVMSRGLARLNQIDKPKSLVMRNDRQTERWYALRMARPAHDWYLKEWLETLGLKPKDIVADLEWNKAKVSLLVNLKQKYSRDEVNDLSDYLNLRPYELLMHPEEAMSLRGLRENAIKIAATTPPSDEDRDGKARDGTTG